MNTLVQAAPDIYSKAPVRQAGETSAEFWGQRFTVLILLTWAASLVISYQFSLTVLMVAGFGAAILGLRRPAVGLLGISMLTTLQAPVSLLLPAGGLLRWNMVNYWLLLVMVLAIPFLVRLRGLQSWLLAALALLMGVQLVGASDLLGGFQYWVDIFTVFGLLVYCARESQNRQIWYWIGIVNGTLAGAGGLSFLLQLGYLPYVDPNFWVMFPLTGLFTLCMGFPFVVDESRGRNRLGFLAVVSLAAINFAWVLLSGSRGGLFIAAVCLIFLIWAMRSLPRRIGSLALAVLLLFAILTSFVDLRSKALTRLGELLDPSLALEDRTSGRSDLMIAAWHLFRENPFGVGTGNFNQAFAGLGSLEGELTFRTAIGRSFGAHSGWMKTLAENGIAGFLLLVSYVLSFTVVGWRKSKRDPSTLALGFLVTGSFSLALISTTLGWRGLWFLAAGVMTLLHREEIARICGQPPDVRASVILSSRGMSRDG